MIVAEPLRTPEDYERALKEIEAYFEDPPKPETEAADRFERLTALILEYEDVHFPISTVNAMAEDNVQGADGDLEQGLMLASDKQYILGMLRSSARVISSHEMIEDPETAEYPEAATVCALPGSWHRLRLRSRHGVNRPAGWLQSSRSFAIARPT